MNSLLARALLALPALPEPSHSWFSLIMVAATEKGSAGCAVGLVPLAIGIIILLWGVREFYVAGRGTLAPWAPPRTLVVTGLYRSSRNPVYGLGRRTTSRNFHTD